jgi:hypothetical protein
MKIPTKRSVAVIATVFIGLLLFILKPNDNGEGINSQTSVAMRGVDKQQYEVAKVKDHKKSNLVKAKFGLYHIEHEKSSFEIDDEMELFDDSEAGIHLKEHLSMLENTEAGSQEKQDASIDKMRKTPEVYIAKLTEAYDSIERVSFLDRYKLVYMMEKIETVHAIPFLAELASSEISAETEPYKGDGHIDESQYESLIRMRAVGGLYTLAKEGDDEARSFLFDTILNTADRTVKNDAIWSFLSSSNDLEYDKEYLKTILPESDHQFVTVKLSNIEEVQEKVKLFDEYAI